MSLMRLLSTGKSLVGVTDNTSRYRMGNQGMMPKFGSGRNPFRSGTKQREGQGEAVARPLTPTLRRSDSPSRGTAAEPGGERESRRTSTVKPGAESLHFGTGSARMAPNPTLFAPFTTDQQPDERNGEILPGGFEALTARMSPARGPALRAMFASWVENLRARIPGRVTNGARAATPRLANAPMQGELSLDKIEVVRNDLSDTDFEITAREPIAPGPRVEASARELKTATKAEPAARADTERSRRLSGRLDEPRRPVPAAAARIPMSQQAAAGPMLTQAGAGWFAPVQR